MTLNVRSAVLCAVFAGATSLAAHGQSCTPAPQPAFHSVNNLGNFSAVDAHPVWGGAKRPIALADPTILVTRDADGPTFYVTGTSDDHSTTSTTLAVNVNLNFPIYKSRDLQNWCLHSVAFDEPTGIVEGSTLIPAEPGRRLIKINGRLFRRLWSPQLYLHPDGQTVCLAFAGIERVAINDTAATDTSTYPGTPFASQANLPGWTYHDEEIQYISGLVCAMNLDSFKAGAPFANGNPGGNQPAWYGYRLNNSATGSVYVDGGQAQGAAAHIPTSAFPNLIGGSAGWLERLVWGFKFRSHSRHTAISDGPFVYFDPQANKRPWLLYSWIEFNAPWNNSGNGNHIYAYPMNDGVSLMDATATNAGFLVAFARNQYNLPNALDVSPINPSIYNGSSDSVEGQYSRSHGKDQNNNNINYHGGVAESPSVYSRLLSNGNRCYYIFYSRNTADSPDYQILYRKAEVASGANFGTSGLGVNFYDTAVAETVLLKSDDTISNNQVHFGNGEIFEAWGKTYLLCHSRQYVQSRGGWIRIPYFKELTINAATGVITPLNESSMTSFLAPIPAP